MKKVFCTIVAVSLVFMMVGCGSQKNIKGKTYDTYGFFNQDTNKSPNVKYKVIIGNVIWSIILFETIIAPVYFLGFDLFEPVHASDDSFEPGVIR